MHDYISGIQQVGIGVKNGAESLREYARLFGMNALVFNDVSQAHLMSRYTGGKVYRRQALLSLNMQGGGGFEIWQFLNREPAMPAAPPLYGDLGIFAPKIKTADVDKAYRHFSQITNIKVSLLQKEQQGFSFWIKDQYANTFQVVQGNHWFQQKDFITGGVAGAVIGVSDMDKACHFYKSLLHIETASIDATGLLAGGPDGQLQNYRRVLLQKKPTGKGAFGKLLGSVEIELVQALDRTPPKIYENRYWGDCGFIHLCFDVTDMCGLKRHAAEKGYSFTVDSIDSFGMEGASGRFCYTEDPDGTLIELVETHKVPVFKKLGIYLHLKKGQRQKPLPDWMIKLLSLSKVK